MVPAAGTGGAGAAGGGAAGGLNLGAFRGNFEAIVKAGKRGDIIFALGVATLLVVLILPMPTWLLDISLAASLTFSVMILMTAVFIEKPLQFSSFPTVLLMATLMRLALNLASTRLILAHGSEG